MKDVKFLFNCRNFSVYPKLLCFKLPNVDGKDVSYVRKRLLKSAIYKRIEEKKKLEKELTDRENNVRKELSSLDWFILSRAIRSNVRKCTEKTIRQHEKKLCQLTKNSVVSFKASEVIHNLSSYSLSPDEEDILKNGLQFSLPPLQLQKSDVFASYELIHRFLKSDLKHANDAGQLKGELSHLTNFYVYNYKPSKSVLKKHGILKRLRGNDNIMISKMDKGNGLVILDKDVYNQAMYKLLSDTTKFKKLKEDLTLKREGQLQRFLRQLKSKSFFNDNNYSNVYPTGSQPARIYGLPKIHKFTLGDPISTLKFRPIVSSIGTYNYNLAKFLCSLLSPRLPSEFSTQDSFTFVKELNQVSLNGKFLVSFDVTSLFTNIPLNETINLAVDLILSNEPNLKINKDEFKKLFFFAYHG